MRENNVRNLLLTMYTPYMTTSNLIRHITGFTGSNAIVVLSLDDKHYFFTDPRYDIQAEKELNGGLFRIHTCVAFTKIFEYMKESGIDRIHYISDITPYTMVEGVAQGYCIPTDGSDILGDLIECDKQEVYVYREKFSGDSYKLKIARVLRELLKNNQEFKEDSVFLITSVENISWLLNIRDADDHNTVPAVLGKVLLFGDASLTVFIEGDFIDSSLDHELHSDPDINFVNKEDFNQQLNNSLFYDVTTIMCTDVRDKGQHINDPITRLRAIKSHVEIANFIHIHTIDSFVLTDFLLNYINLGTYSEMSASEHLLSLRSAHKLFIGNSFVSISACNGSSASIHYHPTKGKDKKVDRGVYLLDSGGHYLGGTTDVTRTILVGQYDVSEHFKQHATRLLQGFIDMHTCVFPCGTSGKVLDVLSRAPLWRLEYNYPHGTGHGIGNYLNVHEGPCGFSSSTELQANMVLTIEPGFYCSGKYGIRMENVVFVKECGNGWLKFEPLTWVPIDLRMFHLNTLSKEQLLWLSWYTREVLKRNSKLGLSGNAIQVLLSDLETISLII
ncbi:MAG: putative aminopeptidase [Candidatus Xenolissoclinum pacificiensis L6]|uniref:Aminopeptidase n=1 Tax=Candidatus Xenolissoclinum pacificiensis L6 TaxID=1401685 RepID=W2V0Z4_9RICK|nr:MAG: putative aminopeptidase [Candidatus Xenolissoclinum pacificiensis L6]